MNNYEIIYKLLLENFSFGSSEKDINKITIKKTSDLEKEYSEGYKYQVEVYFGRFSKYFSKEEWENLFNKLKLKDILVRTFLPTRSFGRYLIFYLKEIPGKDLLVESNLLNMFPRASFGMDLTYRGIFNSDKEVDYAVRYFLKKSNSLLNIRIDKSQNYSGKIELFIYIPAVIINLFKIKSVTQFKE